MRTIQVFRLLAVSLVLAQSFVSAQDQRSISHADIADMGLFDQPILWCGGAAPSNEEAKRLWESIGVGRIHSKEEAVSNIEQYLTDYPTSPFAASLHSHLGLYYRQIGRYSLALIHWEKGWESTKDLTDGNGKLIGDFTLAYWSKLLSSLGRVEKLREIYSSTIDRDIEDGPLTQIFLSSREAFSVMVRKPEISYRCGTLALATVAQASGLPARTLHNVKQIPSPEGGFSLSNLANIAAAEDMPVAVLRRTDQQIVVPSVIHWKENHYAAIVDSRNGSYLVKDPTFGGDKWLSKEVIDAEASGFFIVEREKAPPNWVAATPDELRLVRGKGFPNAMTDILNEFCPTPPSGESCPTDCPPGMVFGGPSGPGANDGCGGCSGGGGAGGARGGRGVGQDIVNAAMPVWSVAEPYMNLWIRDTPLWYTSSHGPGVAFELSYKQRDLDLVPSTVFSVGPGWRNNWLTWVDEQGVDYADLHAASGAVRNYALGITIDYRTQTKLERFAPGGVVTKFELTYPDGSKEVYGFIKTNLVTGEIEKLFLTEKVDVTGEKLTFSYLSYGTTASRSVKLDKVTDGDGRVTQIEYDTTYTNQIKRVIVGEFGYTNTLAYTSGQLSSITDIAGLSTSFQYDGSGWITAMTTPYGTTTFDPEGIDSDFSGHVPETINRSLLVEMPNGGRHLYIYRDSSLQLSPSDETALLPYELTNSLHTPTISPLGQDLDTLYFGFRNSFYWGPLQYSHLSTTNISNFTTNDYNKARLRHWLHSDSPVGETLSIERAPSPDAGGTTWGNTLWYDYAGKGPGTPFLYNYLSILPNARMRVMPDGNTWYIKMDRDEWGHVTNSVEQYGTPTGFALRTNQYLFENQRMVAHIGPDGLISSNRYDSVGNLTNAFNALLEKTAYFYNAKQQLSGMTYPSGLVITNLFFSSGSYSNWLQKTIEIGFATNSFTYTNGLVYTHTDPRGLTITNTWDALQRLTKREVPGIGSTTYTYDKLDLSRVVTPLGTNSFAYDSVRNRTAHTNELRNVTRYDYCNCGSLSSITDALSNITTFDYDNQGHLKTNSFPDGYVVTKFYDSTGRLTNQTDNSGLSTTMLLNMQGLSVGVLNNSSLVLSNRYDREDHLTNSVDANGVTVQMTYDALDRMLTQIHPSVSTNTFAYTARGLTNSINGLRKTNVYVFNAKGQKTSETNAKNETTSFAYNGADDLLTLTDGKSKTTTWNYDQYGRVTNKVQHGGTEILRYRYDAEHRLTNRWSKEKLDTFYTYNWDGTLTNVNYTNSTDISFAYDALGRLTNMVDTAGTSAYTYDAAGQILTENGPWSQDTVTFAYNKRLRSSLSLAQPYSSAWQQAYGYDSERRLTNITSGAGTFSYLLGGSSSASPLVKRLLLPTGAFITNSYGTAARLQMSELKVANVDSHHYAYGYNAANQKTFTERFQSPSAYQMVSYTYDGVGQVESAKATDFATSLDNYNFGYAYDAAGNLQHRTNNALIQTFQVNNLNQLSNVTRTGTLTVGGFTTVTATNVTVNGTNALRYFDRTFALANVTITNGLNSFTALARDANGRSDTNTVTVNLPATVSFTYDQNGNLTSDGNRAFAYNDENQLIRMTVTNQWCTGLIYDGRMRLRVRTESNWIASAWVKTAEVRYIYDGMLPIQERDANNVPRVTYTRGTDLSRTFQGAGGIGGLLSRTDNSLMAANMPTAHAYYHADGNGNIGALVDYKNQFVALYTYDPFGNLLGKAGPLADANTIRFSSKESHPASGLYYYGYRFYEPNLQRWLNRDPIEELGFEAVRGNGLRDGVWAELLETPNLHAFVRNDPVGKYDPEGLRVEASECEQFRIRCYKNVFKSVAGNGAVSAGKTTIAYGLKKALDKILNLGKTASKCLGGGVAAFGVYSLGSNISDGMDEADFCKNLYDRCIDAATKE